MSQARAALQSVTILLPLPSPLIGGNSRGHWAKVWRAKRDAKTNAGWTLKGALRGARPEWSEPVVVRVNWYDRPDRWPDLDNATARLKPILDAAQDVGLYLNDRQIMDIDTTFHQGTGGIAVTFFRVNGPA